VKYEIVGRRMCDVEKLYADPSLALRELNWKASRGLEEMCEYKMTCLHLLMHCCCLSPWVVTRDIIYAIAHICYRPSLPVWNTYWHWLCLFWV